MQKGMSAFLSLLRISLTKFSEFHNNQKKVLNQDFRIYIDV